MIRMLPAFVQRWLSPVLQYRRVRQLRRTFLAFNEVLDMLEASPQLRKQVRKALRVRGYGEQ